MFLVGVHPLSLVFSAGPAKNCKIMVNSVSMASLPGALLDYQRDPPRVQVLLLLAKHTEQNFLEKVTVIYQEKNI